MKTVLITGAGGAALPWLITRLQAQGFRVLAADMDAQAPGLLLADAGFIIPPGTSPAFAPALSRIIREQQVAALIPLVDEELTAAAGLEAAGLIVLLPRLPFVRLCLDKLALMRALAAAGIGIPQTRAAADGAGPLRYPLILKPRTGRGSRGVQRVDSPAELERAFASSPAPLAELMLQEYIDGPEFTVSVVAWRDGRVRAVVPKEVLCKRGITRLAVTRRRPDVEAVCRRVQEHLHAYGPFNVQLRVDGRTGAIGIFEINPRYSTTVTLTQAAGIDEVGDLLREALGEAVSWPADWQADLVLLRAGGDQFLAWAEYAERRARIQPVEGA